MVCRESRQRIAVTSGDKTIHLNLSVNNSFQFAANEAHTASADFRDSRRSYSVQGRLGKSITLLHGLTQPRNRFDLVPLDAITEVVAHTETPLRVRITLLCRFAEPSNRFRSVLYNAIPVIVANGEVVLTRSVA